MNPFRLTAGILIIALGISADSHDIHLLFGEFLSPNTVGNGVSIALLIVGSTLMQSSFVDKKASGPRPPAL